MGSISIGLVVKDVDIAKVAVIWGKLKDLQVEEPKLKITSFNFSD